MNLTFWRGNTAQIELANLVDTLGSYVNDAFVTATIRDTAGVEKAGVEWPVVLGHDGFGTGTYSGIVPDTLVTKENEQLRVHITATVGTSKATWECRAVAKTRSC
jgi:hypothetical protein